MPQLTVTDGYRSGRRLISLHVNIRFPPKSDISAVPAFDPLRTFGRSGKSTKVRKPSPGRVVLNGASSSGKSIGYHAAAACLLTSGNRLILDNAITNTGWRLDLKRRLQGHRAVWVGVLCDDRQLAKRERERGDRAPGTAEREAAVVHEGMHYDVTLDTSSGSPDEAAAAVLKALNLHLGR